jgi:general secretion pathway protein A
MPAASRPAADTAAYELFYGLQERPFSLSTDPKFFYHSAGHDEAAQTLLGAIGRREKFAVLTGELGLGKTILCRAVVDQLDRRTLTSLVAEPFVSPEALLKTVLVDFGVISRDDLTRGRLAKQSRTDLMAALRDFLISLAALQAFAVIILDDAHELPIDMLEQIRVLIDSVGDEALLQVILVGGPTLTKTLGRSELRQMNSSIAVRARLRPIAEDEVFGYITHRLSVSGASPRVEFDEPALARVFELSAGVPRTINVLCDRTLEAGFKKSASLLDRSLVDQAAEELDLAPAHAQPSIARTAATAAGFVALVLLGALLAAFIFRSDLAALGIPIP